jgi:hypothetical protein
MSIGWARVVGVVALLVAEAAVILLLAGAYLAAFAAIDESNADSGAWIKPVISIGLAELAVVPIAFVSCLVGSSRGLQLARIGIVILVALGTLVLWLLSTRAQGLSIRSAADLGYTLLFTFVPGIALLIAALAMRAARVREAENRRGS